ncbi:hypothetical protein SBD_2320 [Streptomyces bottropensis ATCC 25435]|uniref:Uncharacterized protein n=1 Tax=Streptomyces bottropensis ATCC 25435 TaxID=1054862 RepID=M3F407_9ACTN|nr:hypothetical protein SBD_2320 [Streptomyces bottropensis ATCC 25435]
MFTERTCRHVAPTRRRTVYVAQILNSDRKATRPYPLDRHSPREETIKRRPSRSQTSAGRRASDRFRPRTVGVVHT